MSEGEDDGMGSVYKRRRGSLEKNNKRASYNTRARGREALWNSLEICLSNFISRLLMLLSELAIGINSATAGIYQRVGLFLFPLLSASHFRRLVSFPVSFGARSS